MSDAHTPSKKDNAIITLRLPIAEAQRSLKALSRSTSLEAAGTALEALFDFANQMVRAHEGTSYAQITQLAKALSSLLRPLIKEPDLCKGSVQRTIGSAVDMLQLLNEEPIRPALLCEDFYAIVVDDEQSIRDLVVRALDRINLRVHACADPTMVPALLEVIHCPLILLDLNMPDMQGDELAKTIRDLPGYADVPIIFITGYFDAVTRAKIAISGGTDFICKPFLIGELTVKCLIHLRRWRFAHGDRGLGSNGT